MKSLERKTITPHAKGNFLLFIRSLLIYDFNFKVVREELGRLLDARASVAFAIADYQVAHISAELI